jgi:hypothetical protein
LNTQIGEFAGVTENETVLYLPVRLASLGVQWMAVGTLHCYVGFVELLPLSALFQIFALLAEILDAVVLLLLVVVGDFTVSAVHSSLCANLQMLT